MNTDRALTPYTESEAILYAVREDDEGLAIYLSDRERFLTGEVRRLRKAAYRLAGACDEELSNRFEAGPNGA